MLSVFNDFSILFVAVYMPRDMLSNIDEFNFVLSFIHALQQLYLPDHVIYGGDWNVEYSRSHFQHTLALSQFCVEEHLIHEYSRKQLVEYTYSSDIINCSKSLIDHFFISAQLDNCVNKLCVINDIETQSDHLPLVCQLLFQYVIQNQTAHANLFLNRNGLWLILRFYNVTSQNLIRF